MDANVSFGLTQRVFMTGVGASRRYFGYRRRRMAPGRTSSIVSSARDSRGRGVETRVRCMDGNEHGDAPECHRKTAWTKRICRHSEARGGGTLDCVGGTQPLGAANNYSPQQPQPRIKRSLSLSWFYCNAPESDLSEVLVFDRALTPRRGPAPPPSLRITTKTQAIRSNKPRFQPV